MKTSVTVLGLGAMGTALARALLAAGHPTTVWNRTPGRSPELDELGVQRTETAAEAVAASPLVIACLLDYSTVLSALDGVSLTGKVLANLTNGSPGQARETADWAAALGAGYVDGGIMAVPAMIGGPDGFVLYSGSTEAFERHRDDLAALARPAYLGSDPGLAPLHDIALLSAMYGMFGGVTHALALVGTEKVSPTAFTADLLVPWLTAMLGYTQLIAKDLEDGPAKGGAGSNLAMQSAAYGNLVDTAVDQGIDPAMITPMRELLDRAVAVGDGDADLAALVRLLNKA